MGNAAAAEAKADLDQIKKNVKNIKAATVKEVPTSNNPNSSLGTGPPKPSPVPVNGQTKPSPVTGTGPSKSGPVPVNGPTKSITGGGKKSNKKSNKKKNKKNNKKKNKK